MAKAKKAKAKKSAAKKRTKKVKKTAKRAAAKARRAPAKKARKSAAKKAAPRRAAAKKQRLVGEGDYAASRAFLKDQSRFVKKNKAKIPAMGKQAEAALEGPEGDSLRAAEQEAMNRSVIE